MNPQLTDEAVALLPLQAGRAELLEEIMATSVQSSLAPDTRPPPSRRSRWLVPIAAAAAVAGIVAASLWGRGLLPDDSSSVASPPAAQPGHRAVLDAPGWEVSSTENGDDGYGEVSYANDGATFTITWYPAESYESYVIDREHIVDPPAPGEPLSVLGSAGQLWAYSADDHTVIREVEDGFWTEFRGSGMDEAGYRALLDELSLVDRQGFETSLPEDFVTTDERADTASAMLAGITGASGAQGPGGRPVQVRSEEEDPYQLGADVAGAYACAWLKEFQRATAAGATARAAEAMRVLGTSPDWPVLKDMNERGDYPEAVWDYADTVAGGQVPEGFRGGLGCP